LHYAIDRPCGKARLLAGPPGKYTTTIVSYFVRLLPNSQVWLVSRYENIGMVYRTAAKTLVGSTTPRPLARRKRGAPGVHRYLLAGGGYVPHGPALDTSDSSAPKPVVLIGCAVPAVQHPIQSPRSHQLLQSINSGLRSVPRRVLFLTPSVSCHS
jgi:hypothetical protein